MRILNIMLAKARGGVETMAVHYHRAMTESGLTVLSLGHPNGALAQSVEGDAFRPLIARINHDPIAITRLHSYCQAFQPDLIVTHGNRATGLCTLPFLGLRGKTVQVMHNAFTKPHLAHVRAALCVSESVLHHVRQTYPRTRALELENFAPLEIRPVKSSRSKIPVIGALGRLHDQKGFDILLDAVARLQARGVPFMLRIAGDGPEAGRLATQVRQLRLHSHVTFVGWQTEVANYLSGLDLFVVPSRYEPFGLVVIEAMAAGVPVITSDIDGPRQILGYGAFGRLFDTENPTALADALFHALEDPEAMRVTAEIAQNHAIENFGLDAGRQRLRGALGTLVDIAKLPA